MAAKSFRLKISREGYEFEAEGDRPFVMDMLNRFGSPASLNQPIAVRKTEKDDKQPDKKIPSLKQTNTKSLSIREFIQKLAFTKHTDISLAFGYYLEKHSGISDFTRADINNCYYEAKLESSNTSQMIIQNIKRGYLMASKKKGEKGKSAYTLTSSGESFIESKEGLINSKS